MTTTRFFQNVTRPAAWLPFVLVLFVASASNVRAQDATCDKIVGTIQVEDDAPNKRELAQISEAQAREIVAEAMPEATITDIDLEEEDGYLVYEVELEVGNQEHDMYIDAGSGEVLCTEIDD